MPPHASALNERLVHHLAGVTLQVQFVGRVVQVVFQQLADELAALPGHALLLHHLLIHLHAGVRHHHRLAVRPHHGLTVWAHLGNGRLGLNAQKRRADDRVFSGSDRPLRVPEMNHGTE